METAYTQAERLLGQIREKSRNPAIDKIADELEVLCRGYMSSNMATKFDHLKFTPSQKRIINLLYARLGQTVGYAALLDVISSRTGRDACQETLKAHVCRMRVILNDESFRIETVFNEGLRLVESPTVTPGYAGEELK
jgi:hypothetical protein